MSPVYDCQDDDSRAAGLDEAVATIRAGKLVVLPTDTVYGLGADAFTPEAVAAILAAKGRGREMPVAVLVPDVRTIDGVATDVPAYARALVATHWPGPLTLVLRAQASLLWDLGDTNGTVGVRMPDHPVALELLRQTGPLAVTSANRTGQPPAGTIVEAATMLGPVVEVYLDGGALSGGVPSTIVDCTGEEPVVLREGALTQEQVMATVRDAEEPTVTPLNASPAD